MRFKVRRGLRKLAVLQSDAEAFMRSAKRQHPVSCSRCTEAYCCHQLVAVSLLEAIYIVDFADRHELGEWLRSRRLELERQNQALQDPLIDRDDWYWQQIPCPMLRDDGQGGKPSCGIYEGRPQPCRTHLSVSDPEMCNPEVSKEAGFINTGPFAAEAMIGDFKAAKAAGLPFLHGPLQTMLLAAIEYIDRGEQAMLDWLGPWRDQAQIFESFGHMYPPDIERATQTWMKNLNTTSRGR